MNLVTDNNNLVRKINNNKWQQGLDVILNSKGRINDIVIEQKYVYDEKDEIEYAWVFTILQLYNEDNIPKYYKVTSKVSSYVALKMYKRNYGFSIIDYLLRARHCWIHKEEYVYANI